MNPKNGFEEYKGKVKKAVSKNGLTSVMNNTKWKELFDAIRTELSFPPPYQLKDLLTETPYPPKFDEDVWYYGSYSKESLEPYFGIEWIRIRPRYLAHRGKIIPPKEVSIEASFKELLKKYGIPYKFDGECYWIYGYAKDTSEIGKMIKR